MLSRLIEHMIWADLRTNDALATLAMPAAAILRLQAHILGSQATWLARIAGEHATVPAWPELDLAGCRALAAQTHAAFRSRVATFDYPSRPHAVTYTNSRGETLTSTVDDILHHVVMHAMYHRGQVMLGIRTSGGVPQPTDFMVFTRGN